MISNSKDFEESSISTSTEALIFTTCFHLGEKVLITQKLSSIIYQKKMIFVPISLHLFYLNMKY